VKIVNDQLIELMGSKGKKDLEQVCKWKCTNQLNWGGQRQGSWLQQGRDAQ
jgi:hypothetical protein